MGGIEIPHDQGLQGHSDADVLLHAVTDALLGAAALGDIGELFPDTDPDNRGRDSSEMLLAALAKVAEAGFRVVNVDCIVFAQRPKLSPHKETLQKRLAELLGIEAAEVGVKAKTGEGVGEIGREEVMMAQCVALLEKMDSTEDLPKATRARLGRGPIAMLVGGIGTGTLMSMWGTHLFVQGWTLRGGDGNFFGVLAVKGAYCLGGMLIGLIGACLALSSAAVLAKR